MENSITQVIVQNLVEIIAALVSLAFTAIVLPWLTKTAIPWLKEKRLYSIVRKFVYAVEKEAEAGAIDKSEKNSTVISLLESKGIVITPEVRAFIEAAVKELDLAMESGIQLIGDAFGEVAEIGGAADESKESTSQ